MSFRPRYAASTLDAKVDLRPTGDEFKPIQHNPKNATMDVKEHLPPMSQTPSLANLMLNGCGHARHSCVMYARDSFACHNKLRDKESSDT